MAIRCQPTKNGLVGNPPRGRSRQRFERAAMRAGWHGPLRESEGCAASPERVRHLNRCRRPILAARVAVASRIPIAREDFRYHDHGWSHNMHACPFIRQSRALRATGREIRSDPGAKIPGIPHEFARVATGGKAGAAHNFASMDAGSKTQAPQRIVSTPPFNHVAPKSCCNAP